MSGFAGIIVLAGTFQTGAYLNAWLGVWSFVDRMPHRFGRGAARDFASPFSGLDLRLNLRSNHARWMDACGCLVTYASMAGRLAAPARSVNLSGSNRRKLILRVWRRWGKGWLCETLRETFPAHFWDEPARRLWCLRDLIGARPFFYAQSADRFYFSNTLEVLPPSARRLFATRPAIHRRLSPARVVSRRDEDCVPGHSPVTAGHTLVYSEGELRVRRYTDFFCRRAAEAEAARGIRRAMPRTFFVVERWPTVDGVSAQGALSALASRSSGHCCGRWSNRVRR